MGQPPAMAPLITVFHGNELGWQQASALLASRYGLLVGLIGETGSGKTCLLSSLYLLASCSELSPRFCFAGSATLPGFEGRIRNLRQWHGSGLPEQIVDHTILEDERQPGLMHLALKETAEGTEPVDILLTDLPGEWTTDLVRRADKAARLMFLRRADAIVIALSAPELVADESRNSRIQFCRILLQRLRDTIEVDCEIPIIFALTRCDKTGSSVPPGIFRIMEAAESFGFVNTSFTLVAAFSDRSDVPSGLGVGELVEKWFQKGEFGLAPKRQSHNAENRRMFARYSSGISR